MKKKGFPFLSKKNAFSFRGEKDSRFYWKRFFSISPLRTKIKENHSKSASVLDHLFGLLKVREEVFLSMKRRPDCEKKRNMNTWKLGIYIRVSQMRRISSFLALFLSASSAFRKYLSPAIRNGMYVFQEDIIIVALHFRRLYLNDQFVVFAIYLIGFSAR